MNQSDNLEEMLDAGVSSFKIEGRLKEVTYVKNVTAYYRAKLDAIFQKRPEYMRSSSGHSQLGFKPQLDKSFNRGFTDYYLHGRGADVCSLSSPKSRGEEMGCVKELRGNYIVMSGTRHFNNGDGVCYVDETGTLQGFRINKVDQNKLYPQEKISIRPKTTLYRNYDQEFEKLLSRPSAQRKLMVDMELTEITDGFLLTLTDEDLNKVSVPLRREKELARTAQTENLRMQLGKLGNTPFEPGEIHINLSQNYFLPSSVLAEWRRDGIEKLLQARRITLKSETAIRKEIPHTGFYTGQILTYQANAMNEKARDFYLEHGAVSVSPAFEKMPVKDAALMFTRHCIRYMMGWCPVHQSGKSPFQEPYFLVSKDGRKFRLHFDCKNCQMKIYEEA